MTISTIDPNNTYLTFVNWFKVTPNNQPRVVELLRKANAFICCRPGFISANIHESTDGEIVMNYVQVRSRQDLEALFEDPSAVEHMMQIRDIIKGSEKHFFEVASVHHGQSGF
jgi:hypothetical protein